MASITNYDYEDIFESVGRLYECESAETFCRVALSEVCRLVACDQAAFICVAPTLPKVTFVGAPSDLRPQKWREQVLADYVEQHPVLRHYLATGDVWAYKISDFLSVRQYHSLPLYKQLYRDLHCEDQIESMLFPHGSELISVALARKRRSFTERDRQILNLLRPGIARTYRRVEHLERLKPANGGGLPLASTRVTTVLLDTQNRAVRFGNEAQDWIRHFFPGFSGTPSNLPDEITHWLWCHKRQDLPANSSTQAETMLLRRDGQCLRLRLISGLSETERIMVLELQSLSGTMQRPASTKLTRREIEVLVEVERGKSNDEAGAALGISSLTVRTHLEHIFQKLHVPCRTAAVMQFRRLSEFTWAVTWWFYVCLMNAGADVRDVTI